MCGHTFVITPLVFCRPDEEMDVFDEDSDKEVRNLCNHQTQGRNHIILWQYYSIACV